MTKILIVCVGNICRSPIAAAFLQRDLPGHQTSSAGIAALVGHDIDQSAREAADVYQLRLPPHQARQFTVELGVANDLILVMEAGHKRRIERIAPQLSGRTFLFSHWTGGRDIVDPYHRSKDVHNMVLAQLKDAAAAWSERLSRQVQVSK